MKVIAINSSPRVGGQSRTEMMLNSLVHGMRNAGAEVEIINLREKKINNCVGCFTCWSKTPGECIHKDDMTKEIFPKWTEADLVVYATPLYNHTMNSIMSTLMERLLPVLEPFFIKDDDGKTCHPLRSKVPKSVWLSVCGFPEVSEFKTFSTYLKSLTRKDAPLVAEIFRPDAESLVSSMHKNELKDILDATSKAGMELVKSGKVEKDTMSIIKQPLQDLQRFAKLGNIFWKTCIAEGVTVKEFKEKGIIPSAESIEEFILLFPYGLNSKAVGEGKAVLQFDFNGQVNESCYFDISKDNIEAKIGSSENPEIVIKTPFDLWMDIMTQKADGEKMFMEEKYTVEGDLSLMLELFKKDV
ncbi:MAG: hypothetical protein GY760_09980 [Deltaproteobacteria bacterium]|nr:hypothetical protein [Deltaproteobacteria bacterium]